MLTIETEVDAVSGRVGKDPRPEAISVRLWAWLTITSQGLALDIPSGYGSQEPGVEEVRMAVLYAFSSRLTSSSEFINVAVSP